DLILHNGRITTLDRANPVAAAVAIKDGRFVAVGSNADVMPLAAEASVRGTDARLVNSANCVAV
ncbi:hypothetical protein F3J14_22230, partial [Burkholderia sp. Tr-862]|nr:hypothetical protein [Burkholderia sp. Tr-862]